MKAVQLKTQSQSKSHTVRRRGAYTLKRESSLITAQLIQLAHTTNCSETNALRPRTTKQWLLMWIIQHELRHKLESVLRISQRRTVITNPTFHLATDVCPWNTVSNKGLMMTLNILHKRYVITSKVAKPAKCGSGTNRGLWQPSSPLLSVLFTPDIKVKHFSIHF